MALSSHFEIATQMSPREVAELLRNKCGLEETEEGLIADGIFVEVHSMSPFSKKVSRDTYGIDPTVYVVCILNKFDLFEAGQNRLFRVCAELVASSNSDLVFAVGDGEATIVFRKNGKLLLDNREPLYCDKLAAVLKAFGLVFTPQNLASLDP